MTRTLPPRFLTALTTLLVGIAGCTQSTGDVAVDSAPAVETAKSASVEAQEEAATKASAKPSFELLGASPTVDDRTPFPFVFKGGLGPLTVQPMHLKKDLEVRFRTTPNAKVTIAGTTVTTDAEGNGTVVLVPMKLLRSWMDAQRFERTDDPKKVTMDLDLGVTVTVDGTTTKLPSWVHLGGTLRWWAGLQDRSDNTLPGPVVTEGAVGMVMLSPRRGVHYVGPAGDFGAVRYVALTSDQGTEGKYCGRYTHSQAGYDTKISLKVAHQHTTVTDRVKGKKKTSFWTKAENPCSAKIQEYQRDKVYRPGHKWADYTALTRWSRWMQRDGYWGPSVRAKDPFGDWERAWILSRSDDGNYCVRFKRHAVDDRCVSPDQVKLGKRYTQWAAKQTAAEG